LDTVSTTIKAKESIDIDTEQEQWTEVIKPKTGLFDLRLGELWRYRDLIMMFVRREFVSVYKQTILGPLWFFLQPLLTTVMFIIIFGRVAKLSTDGMPMVIFYLAGITIWNYFSITLTSTASTFAGNAHIFGKVYFPRLTMPLSIVISNLVRFLIQFSLFLAVWIYYLINRGDVIHPNWIILLTPILLIMMGVLSLGLGLIFSSLTTKYRDLSMLLAFGVQLLMYATPVIYPLSAVPEKYKWLIVANPITSIVESFRYAFLGSGSFSWLYLSYSLVVALVILFFGIIIFNKVEKTFIDVV
jgi:lipopolysaccharide transport system permease protein